MKRSLLNKDLQSQAEFIVENKVQSWINQHQTKICFIILVSSSLSNVKLKQESF